MDPITITKTVDQSTVAIGQPVTFTIKITNNTSCKINNVIVKDFLPGFINIIVSPGSILKNQTVIHKFHSLPQGDSIITIIATPTVLGPFINTAVLKYKKDCCKKDHCKKGCCVKLKAFVSIIVTPIKLSITKTYTPSNPKINDTVVFSITVTNPSSIPINDIIVTDMVPLEFSIDSTSGCSVVDNLVTCNIGTLLPGTSSNIIIITKANTDGTFINEAVANFSINDISYSESDTVTITVAPPEIQLQFIQEIIPQVAFLDFNVIFSIRVTNLGTTSINNMILTDQVPDNFNNIILEGCTVVGNLVTCNIPVLISGETITFTFTASAIKIGSYTNTAELTIGDNVVATVSGVGEIINIS